MSDTPPTVREAMHADPLAVPPDCPIHDVLRVMNEYRFGAVLVAVGGRLLGIFTERDLLRRVTHAVPGWRDYPVSDWMTPNPFTVRPDVGWDDAADMMHSLRVRHLPVVEEGRVVGILSTRGLMARRAEFLDAEIAARTAALRQANDQLLTRDAETTHYMRAAGRLQTSLLLPDTPPAWPELDWAVHFAPLDHLGGDYYDYATPTADHLGFLIADASGHSIPAVLVAVMTRTAFREAAALTVKPGGVLTTMNARLQGLTDERFVTACYAVLDRRTRVLRYASAGHPPPLLVRADGAVKSLAASGFILGIMAEEVYGEREVTVEPGDRLCFYTDGLVEARNEIGELFGTDRLTECLQSPGTADETLARVMAAQRAFSGPEKLTDDLTVAVIRFN